MAHMRTQIRNAVKNILLNIPTIELNVFFDRIPSLTEAKLPAICIFTGDEKFERTSFGRPAILAKTLSCRLAIIVRDSEINPQEKLDNILLVIEKRVAANITLSNLVQSIELVDISVSDEDDQERPISILNCVLEVKYRVREDTPEIAIA